MYAFLESTVKYKLETTAKLWDSADLEQQKVTASRIQLIDSIIRQFAAHVLFVESAKTPNVPWSVIRPFEKFAGKLIPGITVMLLPQWEYNYGIVTRDLYHIYNNSLTELRDIPEWQQEIDRVFENFPHPFHLVFFPALEKKNILLHCLLSHELGHLLSQQYIRQNEGRFLKENRDEIVRHVEERSGTKEPLFTQQMITHTLERATHIWKRGLDETLSDVVGAILFGPAMLLSVLEMSVQGEMDHRPNEKNSFYPPWRFRLREIYKALVALGEPFFPLPEDGFDSRVCSAVNRRFELIRGIVESNEDAKPLSETDDMRIAYREIGKDVEEAKGQFLKSWKQMGFAVTPTRLYKKLGYLINRLDHGIPPNAYEESVEEREPADIVDIINAAWFHKIAWEDPICGGGGNFNEEICTKREIMNLLTLKAIEFSDLEKEYRSKVAARRESK
jgi:hypothetical protein